ncbi:MAG: HAMP domain-containing histidine kinase [Acidobacteria bacterium]|nr:HAMP domain-containing histidine kinase [Acidobacteriota bacterium]
MQDNVPLSLANDSPTTSGLSSYAHALGDGLQSAHYDLARRWLDRLVALLPVDPQSIFTTQLLLDHIPGLIQEIGRYVATPAEEDIAAKAVVLDKARELGQLRHQQQASLHQVLREYDLLGEILEQFVIEQTRSFPGGVAAVESLDVSRRVNRAVRVLMQVTARTFIAAYTETITEQATRLDRFNRAVSHELRNVMGTVHFGAQLLQDARVAADVTRRDEIIASIGRNSSRAIKIIRSFERLPRSGIMSDSPSEQLVEVRELVEEVFRQLREMAEARGVELRTTTGFPTLYLDSGALELVLINLASNAIKYADPHKTSRFVAVAGRDHAAHFELRVDDNGLGIPAHAANNVFERFTRAHADMDSQLGVDGTGLGLSIVEECVKSLGGTISLESQEHVGTTFTILVPKKLPPIPTA